MQIYKTRFREGLQMVHEVKCIHGLFAIVLAFSGCSRNDERKMIDSMIIDMANISGKYKYGIKRGVLSYDINVSFELKSEYPAMELIRHFDAIYLKNGWSRDINPRNKDNKWTTVPYHVGNGKGTIIGYGVAWISPDKAYYSIVMMEYSCSSPRGVTKPDNDELFVRYKFMKNRGSIWNWPHPD